MSACADAGLRRGCDRLRLPRGIGKAQRFDRLVASEAWIEAALELVAIEATGWTVQRVCLDNGEWFCTLSRHPDTPNWLDDAAEASHGSLPLAVLGALLEVSARVAFIPSPRMMGCGHLSDGLPVDCDEYR